MTWPVPAYSRNQVNRAGRVLIQDEPDLVDYFDAGLVLGNWRACHGYPVNTFQATLRARLREIDANALVAQRLKRTPSILAKLRRFPGMQLARMQDIGGLRAVVSSLAGVRAIEKIYRERPFAHELVGSKDYISHPKPDGYRGIHLIFRYQNRRAVAYNGLTLELQIRTKRQHAWATAVETMGTFLGQALKSNQGERRWREFFEVAGAAFAHVERAPPVPGYEQLSAKATYRRLAETEAQLQVLSRLEGFAIAADAITADRRPASYHLIILDSATKTVRVKPFSRAQLEQATVEYSRTEELSKSGAHVEAVLVSAGPIQSLRRAYPNYFLDTRDFIKQVRKVTL